MIFLNKFLELICKSTNLYKELLCIYSKPELKIFNINREQTEISYISRSCNEVFSRHVKDFFSHDHLILYFNSSDASRIGYLYGIWLQSKQ